MILYVHIFFMLFQNSDTVRKRRVHFSGTGQKYTVHLAQHSTLHGACACRIHCCLLCNVFKFSSAICCRPPLFDSLSPLVCWYEIHPTRSRPACKAPSSCHSHVSWYSRVDHRSTVNPISVDRQHTHQSRHVLNGPENTLTIFHG